MVYGMYTRIYIHEGFSTYTCRHEQYPEREFISVEDLGHSGFPHDCARASGLVLCRSEGNSFSGKVVYPDCTSSAVCEPVEF